MTFEQRVETVVALGFTDRQARFLVTVAVHSGYCLRRQYEAFAGIRYGKNVRVFLDGLVTRGVAERFGGRADRGHIYHLHGRALYRAIGEDDHRHRRQASPAQIARKLMLLDLAIRRNDLEWFVTDRDKVALCVDDLHVPTEMLPRPTTVTSGHEESPTQYFPHRFPIGLSRDTVPHVVYLATDGSPDRFASFLRDHALLLRSLSKWAVLVGTVTARPALQSVFDAFAASLRSTNSTPEGELQWYFERRRLVDGGDLAQISVFDLRRFRALRQRFDSAAHHRLYADWMTTGRIGGVTPGSPTGDSIGTLITELLPFAYEQFGSLPGVA
jgi:hypothetical protein